MATKLDWQTAEDPRDVVHLAVQALAEGQLVAIPTECCYAIAASAVSDVGAEKIRLLNQNCERPTAVTLISRGSSEPADFCRGFNGGALRLAKRLWPGPLRVSCHNAEDTPLFSQLPRTSQALLAHQFRDTPHIREGDRFVTFAQPMHPAIAQIRQLLRGPMMFVDACQPNGHPCTDAEQIDSSVPLIIDDGPTHYRSVASWVTISANRYVCLSSGTVSLETIQLMSRYSILFVCTGNTCRSPMAEKMMEKKLCDKWSEENNGGSALPFEVRSAGVSAMPGSMASVQSCEVVEDMGLSLESHSSTPISESLVTDADVIITMTEGHRQALLQRWPDAVEKTHALATDGSDISDPFGSSLTVYQKCSEQISKHLDNWVERLWPDGKQKWNSAE